MSTQYLSDVESFVAHDDVSARESMAGSSFLVGAATVALVVGFVLWWQRRAH